MPLRRIPVLAGAENNELWSEFTRNIRLSAANGTPLEGSFGVHFNQREDIRSLAECVGGNGTEMISTLVDRGILSKRRAEMFVNFYLLATGEQIYFFLRRGHTILGLYRKTGGYIFDERQRYPHRLNYQFVRHATPTEASQSLWGRMTPTLIWWNAEIPDDTPRQIEIHDNRRLVAASN